MNLAYSDGSLPGHLPEQTAATALNGIDELPGMVTPDDPVTRGHRSSHQGHRPVSALFPLTRFSGQLRYRRSELG